MCKIYTMDEIYQAFKSFKFLKDKEPRPGQLEAIHYAINSPSSIVVVKGPVGSGKSIVGVVLMKLAGDSIYLVQSKALQYQIVEDFPEVLSLFGRSNYPCVFTNGLKNVAECSKKEPKIDCPVYNICVYRIEKEKVARHPLRIINYQYHILETNYAKKSRFTGKPLVVCDEADTLEQTLLDFVSIKLSLRQINKFKLQSPRYKTATAKLGVLSWIEWAERSIKRIERSKRLLSDDTPRRELEAHESLLSKLRDFIELVDDTWIYDINDKPQYLSWTFSPTWITPEISERYWRSKANKFILMSATFPTVHAISLILGIPVDEIDYFEIPSSFSVKNKPVYLSPVAEISAHCENIEYEKIKEAVERILNKHKGEKGLIHTHNYKLRDKIMEIKNPRLITHDTKSRNDVLEMFKQSNDSLVLVSPSMERGVSLDDDMARFLISTKAPFPDLNDKQINKRFHSGRAGKYWYRAITAQTIEQQAGRGVRNDRDWCHIYLLDNHIKRLIVNEPMLFSKHFRDCIVWGVKI